ncbi:MAG: hypothetical protein M1816_002638 [Peltula sp. TS41687]|nr:MAG: hypothetical protein M1816_002638 [Peltula sp. TS41687]
MSDAPSLRSTNPRAIPAEPEPVVSTRSRLAAAARLFSDEVEGLVEQLMSHATVGQQRNTTEPLSTLVNASLNDLQMEVRSGFAALVDAICAAK